MVWSKQVKRVLHWLLKIFFAASIGFVVPVRDFGDLTVIGNACILFIAVLGKLATGLWVVPLRKNEVITVGLAMSAWGEFAFITATTARREGLMDEYTFSAVVLAVMISVVLSPTLLRLHLSRSSKTAIARVEHAIEQQQMDARPTSGVLDVFVCYRLQTVFAPAWGLNAKLLSAVRGVGLEVLDFRSHQLEDRHLDFSRLVVNEIFLEDRHVSIYIHQRFNPCTNRSVYTST